VLGRKGMVGQAVYEILSRSGLLTVEGTERATPSSPLYFEATSGTAGLQSLWRRKGGYAFLINCIGMTKPTIEERDPLSVERAIHVNALLPHRLALFASEVGARVIHLSTDCVFSGKGHRYTEDAPHDPLDVYGKTKSLGDVIAPEVLTIRCSVIGPDPVGHRGLLEWFLGHPEGKDVTGYTDSLWNGVTTLQFATLCRRIIAEDRFERLRDESPVHHFCPNHEISKYELLRLFAEVYGRRIVVNPGPTPGGPLSRLLVTKHRGLHEMFGEARGMADALREMVQEIAR